ACDGIEVLHGLAVELKTGQSTAAATAGKGTRLRSVTAALQRHFDTHGTVAIWVVAVGHGRRLAVEISAPGGQGSLGVVVDNTDRLAEGIGAAGRLSVVTVIDAASSVARWAPHAARRLVDRSGRERTARAAVETAVGS